MDDDVRYCVCRSTETAGRFMIACDACEDWFHGDCVQVKKSQAKIIRKFFCPPCRNINPNLVIKYRSAALPDKDKGLKRPKKEHHHFREEKKLKRDHVKGGLGHKEGLGLRPAGCGNCIGCFRSEDCGRCDDCRATAAAVAQGASTKALLGCRLRHCVNPPKAPLAAPSQPIPKKKKPPPPSSVTSSAPAKEEAGPSAPSAAAPVPPASPAKRPPGRPKTKRAEAGTDVRLGGTRNNAKAYRDFLRDAGLLEQGTEGRGGAGSQCLGPGCQSAARKGSKYCGEECGLALARARLTTVLPRRLAEWRRIPSAADRSQEAQLAEVKRRQAAANERLTKLQEEENVLTNYLGALRHLPVLPAAKDAADEASGSFHCVTCGLEVPVKTAVKHLLRCFRKYESQSSYGIPSKTPRNPYNIFCETYTKVSKVYCRRLRVICPEHSKDCRLVDKVEVCGYWEGWREFVEGDALASEPTVCRAPWKTCQRHYQWERLSRALIDQERLGHLFGLDELMEEERQLRVSLAARGSVLALLLHSTRTHQSPASALLGTA